MAVSDEWNIDDLEVGKMYVVEAWHLKVSMWDEHEDKLKHKCQEVLRGSILMLVESYSTIEWEDKAATGWDAYTWRPQTSTANKRKGTFHSFLFGERLVLLERTDLYSLAPCKYSKTVQTDVEA